MYRHKSLKVYLDDLAARKPTPGGGSASALVGALGLSLLSMAANYTIGKERYKDKESQMRKILSSTEILRKRLLELVDLDTYAYRKFYGAKKKAKEEFDKALNETKIIPRQIIGCCQKGLKLSSILVKKGNVNLISDVKAAKTLLEAAQKAAREFC